MKAMCLLHHGSATRRRKLLAPFLAALISLAWLGAPEASFSNAVPHPASRAEVKPGYVDTTSRRILASREESRKTGKKRALERQQRLLHLADDFLGESLAVSERQCAGIESEIDRVPLLDFPARENDLRGLLESCRDHMDRLREMRSDLEEGQVELSTGHLPEQSWWRKVFGALLKSQEDQGGRLESTVAAYDREERRLAGILERRRELESSVRTLDERLARIEESIKGLKDGNPAKGEKRRHADRTRTDLTIVQNELLSLPLVDEGLLKHYAVLAERGRGEMDLLSFRRSLAAAFRETAIAVGSGAAEGSAAAGAAYRAFARECQRQSDRVGRKIDEVYRKRSRVTPAGTLREMDRSRELADYYDELKGYLQSYKSYLGVLKGSLEYEMTAMDNGPAR